MVRSLGSVIHLSSYFCGRI